MKRKRGYNMSRIFITGDTHGSYDIQKLARKNFPEGKTLTKDDYVIICGDFGCVWGGELVDLIGGKTGSMNSLGQHYGLMVIMKIMIY